MSQILHYFFCLYVYGKFYLRESGNSKNLTYFWFFKKNDDISFVGVRKYNMTFFMPLIFLFQLCSSTAVYWYSMQFATDIHFKIISFELYFHIYSQIYALDLKQTDICSRSSKNTLAPTSGKHLGWYTAFFLGNVLYFLYSQGAAKYP